jgi:alkylation response protein AidB-like acyl-CoA dehydrogenase
VYAAMNEEQRAIVDAVVAVLADQCSPAAVRASWADDAEPARAELVELGLLALAVPEDHGGLGLGLVALAPALVAAGEAALPGTLAIDAAVVAPFLARIGHPDAEAAREGVVRVAVDAGSGLVDGADRASWLLTLADDGVTGGPFGASRVPTTDGARRLFSIAAGSFRRLGGASDRDDLLARGALATACELVGLGRRMIQMATEHARVRHQFGKPIGTFQAVKHQLADAWLGLEMARPLTTRAAWCLDHGYPNAATYASMAKAAASEAALQAGRAALQVHGALGTSEEHDLHLWLKRSWALSRAWGDAASHYDAVARALRDDNFSLPRSTPHA